MIPGSDTNDGSDVSLRTFKQELDNRKVVL